MNSSQPICKSAFVFAQSMAVALTRSPALPPPSTYYYSTPAIPSLDPNIKIAMEGNFQRMAQPQLDHSSSPFQPMSNYESTSYRLDTSVDHFISPPPLRMDDEYSSQNNSAPFKPVISKNGFLIVYNYSPTEGESKVPISATVELCYPAEAASWEGQVKLRLVLGRTALTTSVRPLEVATDSRGENAMVSRWQVSAITPPFEKARFPRHVSVPLTLQALVNRQEVLDTITFGTFSYWESAAGVEYSDVKPNTLKRPREEELPRTTRTAPAKRSPQQHNKDVRISRSSPSSSNGIANGIYIPVGKGSQEGIQISLASQGTTLIAAHGLRESGDGKGQRAVLEWVVTQSTPHPDTFDKNWSSEERVLGRRLVRFHRGHESSRLLVACDTIAQDIYSERDIVISCICRPDANTFWFTSVDIIYLLERLVGASFTVEEKNRIRRNLEGFKPTTVSKSRPGFETFFQRIMDFPVPKPRNIEKDVKVFPWAVLSPALHKILSKYSLYVGSANPQVSPWLHADTPSGSPEGIRTSLPPQNMQGVLPSHDERPFSSHSTRPSFPNVPSQSSLDGQHDAEPQVPGLTFPETNSHDISGPWRNKPVVPMDQSSDRMVTDGGLPSGSHAPHEVFTSAYMRNASSPFITLGEVPCNGHDTSGPSPDTPFRARSVTPAVWSRSGTWLGGANSRSRHDSPDNQGDGVDVEKRKDVSYGVLNTAQHGNSLLLELDPSSSSADDIYPQYSLGNQTPIDDIIDHS